MEIKIDNEFEHLIKPLTDEEYHQLEENILEEGLREPITIWGEIIVDGHNRFRICQEHDIEPLFYKKDFPTRAHAIEWIIKNQFGRRNLPTHERLRLAMILENSIKERAKQNQGTRTDILQQIGKGESVHTDKELGELAGVSRETVRKYRKIQDDAPDEIREMVNTGEITVGRGYDLTTPKRKDPGDESKLEDTDKSDIIMNEIDRLQSYYGSLIEIAMQGFNYYLKCNFPETDPIISMKKLTTTLSNGMERSANEIIERWKHGN